VTCPASTSSGQSRRSNPSPSPSPSPSPRPSLHLALTLTLTLTLALTITLTHRRFFAPLEHAGGGGPGGGGGYSPPPSPPGTGLGVVDVGDVELAYGRGGLARGSFSSLDVSDPVDETEGGEGGEGGEGAASHGQALSKPSMTQQELVGRRLGQSSGKVRGATEVVTLVQQLSSMLAVRLQRLSTNFLNEAGSVLQTIMDAASKQFAVELLLPWVQRIALLEPAKAKRVPSHVEGLGFRVATCDACLTEVFAYTLEVSGDGLPPLLAKFWRHLANAVPAKVVGQTPHNVMVLAHWIKGQERERPSERDKRICSALLWFVKGLALAAEVEATGASAAAAKKRWQSAGGVARKASTCTCTCTSAACLCHAVCHIPCAVPLLPLPCAIALCQCLVPLPCVRRSSSRAFAPTLRSRAPTSCCATRMGRASRLWRPRRPWAKPVRRTECPH
jgi:hypothetical protein